MTRVCPSCNNILSSVDSFFCSFCGAELPQQAAKFDISVFRKVYVEKNTTDKEFLVQGIKNSLGDVVKIFGLRAGLVKAFVVIAGTLFVLIAVKFTGSDKHLKELYGYLMTIYRGSNDSYVNLPVVPKQNPLTKQKPHNTQTVKNHILADIRYERSVLGTDALLKYVPFDASLVIESKNLEFALDLLGLPQDIKNILLAEGNFTGKNVTYWLNNSSAGLLAEKQKVDFVLAPEMFDEDTELTYANLNGAVAVSLNKDLLAETTSVSKLTSKSFVQNPAYIVLRQNLGVIGEIFVMTPNDLGLELLAGLDVPVGVETAFEKYLEEKYTYGIIN